MKISEESPSRMVLKDNNISEFLVGLLCMIMGIGVVLLIGTQDLIVVAVGAIFFLAGLYLFLQAKIVTIVLDKGLNRCSVSLMGVLKRESKEVGLDRIKSVTLQSLRGSSHSSKGGSGTYYQFTLRFVLDDGDELPFEFGKVSAGIMDVLVSPFEQKRKEAQKVADFLNVPLKEIKPPSITEALTAMKEGIAEGIARTKREKPS